MPVYSYICSCGHKKDEFKPLRDHAIELICTKCGEHMKKNYKAMIPAYHDVPVDSVEHDLGPHPIVYHTRGQLKEIAKQHGCEMIAPQDLKGRSRGFNGE